MRRALLIYVLACLLVIAAFTWAEAQVIAQRVQRQSITAAGADCTTASACVALPDVFRTSNGSFDVDGTWTGTLAFEGSIDCSTWRSLSVTPLSGTPNAVSTTALAGTWAYSAPLCGVRVRAAALSSGTPIVSINAVSAGGGGGGGGGAASSVTQGTSPWVTSLTPADTTTGSTALGALNATIVVSLAGQTGAVFQLQSGGTGVYTVTPECSFDGGTLYPLAVQITNPSTGIDAPTQTISSGQATTPYTVVCPFGASHAQVRVSTYTSGTANWLARATVGGFPNSVPTLLTAAPTVSSANATATVTLTGATGQRVCLRGLVIFATGATSTAVTLTIQDGGTIVLDLGIPQLTTLSVPVSYSGTPLLCGSTGNNVVVNIGAGGTSVITHTSVVADRG